MVTAERFNPCVNADAMFYSCNSQFREKNAILPIEKFSFLTVSCTSQEYDNVTYILLTKREGRTGRISARGLDSTDRAQRGPYKKDRGPIFSKCGSEQAWLIRDL